MTQGKFTPKPVIYQGIVVWKGRGRYSKGLIQLINDNKVPNPRPGKTPAPLKEKVAKPAKTPKPVKPTKTPKIPKPIAPPVAPDAAPADTAIAPTTTV